MEGSQVGYVVNLGAGLALEHPARARLDVVNLKFPLDGFLAQRAQATAFIQNGAPLFGRELPPA